MIRSRAIASFQIFSPVRISPDGYLMELSLIRGRRVVDTEILVAFTSTALAKSQRACKIGF